uniref:Gem-associated protein 2 n=2 Tax=Mesocestoides corti TaxID=53468 RepID=A0A5K3ES60_MESCO
MNDMYTSLDHSSDDELLQQALPVYECDEIDPPDASKFLLCANDYLRHVRLEASKLPETLTFHIEHKDEAKNEASTLAVSRNPHLCSSNCFHRAYANFFRLSKKDFYNIVGQKFCWDSFMSPSNVLISVLSVDDCRNWLATHQPKLSYFVGLSQANVVKLLEVLLPTSSSKWDSNHETWLYAGLLALEQPLHPDTCFLIRTIAKTFQKLLKKYRSQNMVDSKAKRFCHIIISVVAFEFGQRDLVEAA